MYLGIPQKHRVSFEQNFQDIHGLHLWEKDYYIHEYVSQFLCHIYWNMKYPNLTKMTTHHQLQINLEYLLDIL